jgi:hypothetical protein
MADYVFKRACTIVEEISTRVAAEAEAVAMQAMDQDGEGEDDKRPAPEDVEAPMEVDGPAASQTGDGAGRSEDGTPASHPPAAVQPSASSHPPQPEVAPVDAPPAAQTVPPVEQQPQQQSAPQSQPAAQPEPDTQQDVAQVDSGLTVEEIRTWTLVRLKAELRNRSLPVSGNKAALLERLEAALRPS